MKIGLFSFCWVVFLEEIWFWDIENILEICIFFSVIKQNKLNGALIILSQELVFYRFIRKNCSFLWWNYTSTVMTILEKNSFFELNVDSFFELPCCSFRKKMPKEWIECKNPVKSNFYVNEHLTSKLLIWTKIPNLYKFI